MSAIVKGISAQVSRVESAAPREGMVLAGNEHDVNLIAGVKYQPGTISNRTALNEETEIGLARLHGTGHVILWVFFQRQGHLWAAGRKIEETQGQVLDEDPLSRADRKAALHLREALLEAVFQCGD